MRERERERERESKREVGVGSMKVFRLLRNHLLKAFDVDYTRRSNECINLLQRDGHSVKTQLHPHSIALKFSLHIYKIIISPNKTCQKK